jgi:phosphomannomutase
LASGIEKAGGSAYNVGLSTTPAMYSCCTNETILNHDINDRSSAWPFDGTIMITASHLPSHWNGFKLFTKDHPSNIGAEGIGALIEAIESSDYDDITPSLPASGPIICDPYLPVYSRILQNTVKSLTQDYDQPLKGFNIIVNAGNGAGGFLAQTLAELGANTSQSLHLEPDGSFPNHIANPEDKVI